jgi:integrase
MKGNMNTLTETNVRLFASARGWIESEALRGLRMGEVLNLKTKDVNLDQGVLTIVGAKFGKTRPVPIHASTQKVLVKIRAPGTGGAPEGSGTGWGGRRRGWESRE